MSHRLSPLRPSPAMAVAVAALLAACGGIAVAATTSRAPVIRACANRKTGALRLARTCRRSERSVSWNKEGIRGAPGLTGTAGPTGPAGLQGAEGPKGEPGQSALTSLQSGQTEHGVIGMATVIGSSTTEAAGELGAYATLPVPAPVPLDSAHVLVARSTDKGACTGSYASPTAPAGDVCIYVDHAAHAEALLGFVPFGEPTPYGFGLLWHGRGRGTETYVEGDWAYTAP